MKTLKILSIGVLASTFGLIGVSTNAEEQSQVHFTFSVNEASPEAQVFVPTEDRLQERLALGSREARRNRVPNSFLQVDWDTDISIELDDSELIERTYTQI